MIKEVRFETGGVSLEGHLSMEEQMRGWVIFAHGSGSSRKSLRNNWVAKELNKHGFGTFLFDLLTLDEDEIYQNRFNIPLLAERLQGATEWLIHDRHYNGLPIAFFGASTGAAAALVAAREARVFTVISRGGRPDLAGQESLSKINVPVMLLVGSLDTEVIKLNEWALRELNEGQLTLVPGATHLFEEPGTLGEVVRLSIDWLVEKLPTQFIAESW